MIFAKNQPWRERNFGPNGQIDQAFSRNPLLACIVIDSPDILNQCRVMDYNLMKSLHVAAALGVFTALGAIVLGVQDQGRKAASILHGVSLLLLLLVGFALLKKPPMELHYWKIKIVLWLFLGVAPALARRKALPTAALLALTLAAGLAAAYLGIHKSF